MNVHSFDDVGPTLNAATWVKALESDWGLQERTPLTAGSFPNLRLYVVVMAASLVTLKPPWLTASDTSARWMGQTIGEHSVDPRFAFDAQGVGTAGGRPQERPHPVSGGVYR